MHIEKKTLKNIFIGAAGCIVLYWLLNSTENVKHFFSTILGILSPFIVGFSIAFILNVPMHWLETKLVWIKRDKLRRGVAIVVTLLFALLLLTLVFCLLIPQLIITVQNLFKNNPQIKDWVMEYTDIESLNWFTVAETILSVFGTKLTSVVTGMFSAIGNITGALMNAIISVVFAVYCLFQKETLARQTKKILYAYVPEAAADKTLEIARLANTTFSNFLSGQCIEVCILGTMFAITMAIFRMPYIPLISVLIAITAFIPVVGAYAGCVLGTFIILVDDPVKAVIFVVLFIVLQQIENNLIYPRVVGTSIGLSGMWVLVAVAVGGELLGVSGMFVMIPVAAVIQTLLRDATHKRLEEKQIDPVKYTTVVVKKKKRRVAGQGNAENATKRDTDSK